MLIKYKRLCAYVLFILGLLYMFIPLLDSNTESLPDTLESQDETEDNPPYRIFPNAWPPGNSFPEDTVCLASHSTVQYLHWIPTQAENWQGLMSVSIYVQESQWNLIRDYILYMRRCHDSVARNVAFHLFFPSDKPPTTVNPVNMVPCDSKKTDYEVLLDMGVQNHEKQKWYPQNLARNLARDNCPTPFALSVDIDMIPWRGMGVALNEFFAEVSCHACVYIVPVYEIKNTVTEFPPKNKETLLSLIKQREAQIFHIEVWKGNQMNSKLDVWEKFSPEHEHEISVLYDISTYSDTWEPISVIHKSAPRFDERFVGYGKTRSSHVYHLYYLDYSFQVLENAFLSHFGFQNRVGYMNERFQELNTNTAKFIQFVAELEQQYGKPAKTKS